MSDSPYNPRPDKSKPASSDGIGATIFLVLFATPFAGFGLVAGVQGVRKLMAGNSYDGSMLCLFALVFGTVGFGLMAGAIVARKKIRQRAELRKRFGDKLWMLRPDWARGEVKSTAQGQVVLLWIMALRFAGLACQ